MCDVRTNRGIGLIELLFVLALGLTLTGMAVPLTADVVEETRVASAARNLATRIGGMRIDALKRSTCIGMRFQRAGPDDYSVELFVDGNGNGVRTAEISAGSTRNPRILTWASERPRNCSPPSGARRTRSPVRYIRWPGANGSATNRRAVSACLPR